MARNVQVHVRQVAGTQKRRILLNAVRGVGHNQLSRNNRVNLVAVRKVQVLFAVHVLLRTHNKGQQEGRVVECQLKVGVGKRALTRGGVELVALHLTHQVEQTTGLHLLTLIRLQHDVIKLEPHGNG